MSGRKSGARLAPSEAREEFTNRATDLWDDFNAWYREHPGATFDEIEKELGQQRRVFLGEFLELTLRQGELGATAEAPDCRKCGKPMELKGYVPKTVHGLDCGCEDPSGLLLLPHL